MAHFFKKLWSNWNKLEKTIRVLIVSVLVVSITFSTTFLWMKQVQKNDLSSYVILNSALQQKTELNFETLFIENEYLNETFFDDNNAYYTLYLVVENYYNYLLDGLKLVRFTNNSNDEINEQLETIKNNISTIYSATSTVNEVLLEEDVNATAVQVLHSVARDAMLDTITRSKILIPELNEFIKAYAKKTQNTTIETYLMQLQFDYFTELEALFHGSNTIITAQINDLKAIATKFKAFHGDSTSPYKNSFIEAYENYYAVNYYKASSKYVYVESIMGQEQIYAQAFYNFLSQESYN